MSKYYVTGYDTPADVANREDVKRYQQQLGVAVDGIWGPKTQAAYEASQSAGKSLSTVSDPWSLPKNTTLADVSSAGYGLDVFTQYYNQILSQLSAPTITIDVPSTAELTERYSSALRPGVDMAIATRRKTGDTNMAELDADAAARGMGSSTYVSSMKEREQDDVEDDIMALEANYSATLSERITDALEYYSGLEMQAESQNAEMAYNAQNTALGLASQWYMSWITMQQQQAAALANAAALQQTSGGSAVRSSSRSSSSSKSKATTPTASDMAKYVNYIKNDLSDSERKSLFSSSAPEWAAQRKSLISAVGNQAYSLYKAAYGDNKVGGTVTWQRRK